MYRNKKKLWFIAPCVIGAMALFVWFFQWLWNAVLPDVLGVKLINYWQALGILVLSKIIFGRIGGKRKRFPNNNCDWNSFEKEKMKQTWKQKFESKFCEKNEH